MNSSSVKRPPVSTILVADDDRVLAQLLFSRLSKAGYKVVIAYDAMQAIMTAIRILPAAVILDIHMPAGTGIEVLKRLKTSTKTSSIPIVVLSGSVDPTEHQSIRDLGADEFLTKPPDLDQLEAILKRVIEHSTP